MSSLIKWQKGGLKSPAARAQGLGSAKSGTHHWIAQRVTAVGNLVLGLWLLCTMVCNAPMNYTDAVLWISEPLNAVLMILFVISTFYHAVLGAQVVIEDYVHNEAFKIIKLLAQKLIFFAMAVACIFSVLQVAL
jgi:succinate dehydrogenase / fumarate reductase, membrane anchor subunit